jgi:hypothetical protein
MRLIALAVLLGLLIHAFPVAEGLTKGEIAALGSILENWPALKNATYPWDSKNLSMACELKFEGIGCSSSPDTHVTSLYVLFADIH